MHEMKGAEAFCRTLESLGAEIVFGVPGSQNVPLFEALRTSALRTVLASSELGAAFMANGYYRASGRPGIVTTIPGPGFTYALTGITEARHDSAAVLLAVVTPTRESGRRFQLQDIDHQAMAGPVVKESFRVAEASNLGDVLRRAWAAATVDGPGPVLLEFAADCLGEPASASAEGTVTAPEDRAPDRTLVEAARLKLTESDRVVLFIGQGAADASEAVLELAEALEACVLSTSSGRGVVSEAHPRSLGGDFSVSGGIHIVNELIETSDLVLVLGSKLSHNGTSGFRLSIPEEKLIHVDSSTESLEGNYPALLRIRSDCRAFLKALGSDGRGPNQGRNGWALANLESWRKRLGELNQASNETSFPRLSGEAGMGLQEFFRVLRDQLPDDGVVVTDSGLHQVATRKWYEVRAPRGLILPSDFQSMGFGIPAAIGASLAMSKRKVVAIVGDGGMAMSGLELASAVREGIDLTVVVFNDGHLGQIRLQQLTDYGQAHGTELAAIDFRLLAEAVGASYLAIDGSNLGHLAEALANPGVTVVDLLLEDSPGLKRTRAKSLIKAATRNAVPSSLWQVLKRVLRRG